MSKYHIDAIQHCVRKGIHSMVLRTYSLEEDTAREAVDSFMGGDGVLVNEIDVGNGAFVVDVRLIHGGS